MDTTRLMIALTLAACDARTISESDAPRADKTRAEVAVSQETIGAESKSDAPALELVEGHSRLEDTGFIHILGEVRNKSDKWLQFVHVDITLLDAEGKAIGVDSVAAALAQSGRQGQGEGSYSPLDYVAPGETAIFHYVRDSAKLARPYASHKLKVRASVGPDVYGAKMENLSAAKSDEDTWSVKGDVLSTGSSGCKSPGVVIGLYAADGKLWDSKETSNDEWFLKILPKGQSAAISYPVIFDPEHKIASAKVWADCDYVDP